MITFPFTDVINAIRNAKKGVEVRENLAQMGEYCKQFTEEAGQKANAARDEAKGYAANAKASEKKATDAVAGIEQTKTDAVQAVQNAQTTATNAVQQAQSTATTAVTTKQTEAVQAVGTAQTGAVKAVDDKRDAALQQVANSTEAAKTAASNAGSAASAAGDAATAAGGYASNAESSATAASGSASAAATSESKSNQSAKNSEASAARSEAAAKKAEAVVGTDKTLTVSGAPADAKAVGDYILDSEGNVIFYSKTAVDELLEKKLNLTGGTMGGEIAFSDVAANAFGGIKNGTDAANAPGGALNDLVIRSWWGVSFTTDCPNQTYTGKTAVGIDCREGIIKAPRFEGPADNGVVASGSNYVRFGDGTQICWGEVLDVPTGTFVTFPLAFSAIPRFIMTRQYGAPTGGAAQSVWGYNTSNTGTYIGGEINIYSHWIAIGRWK